MESIIGKSLAYHEPLLTREKCELLSKLVFSLLSPSGNYLTYATFGDDFRLRGWTPCTKHTIGTGILGFDQDFAFLIWVRDDD